VRGHLPSQNFILQNRIISEIVFPMTTDQLTYGLLARVNALRPNASETMRSIMDLLEDDPTLPISVSIHELAERSGVSPATVTRFCRQLGYPGYTALRAGVAAESGRGSITPESKRHETLSFNHDSDPQEILDQLIAVTIQSVRSAGDFVDIKVAQAVAQALVDAKHIDIYGVGGSGAVANTFEEQLYHQRLNARAFSDVHLGLMSAALLDEHSVAVGVSITGRTKETLEMVAAAKRAGAKTVGITADPQSPLAELVDFSIRTPVAAENPIPHVFGAKHIQLFMSDLITALVTRLTYDATRKSDELIGAIVTSHRERRSGKQPITPHTTSDAKGTTKL
jgi:DNA-binding MurR/RpiR family transcriptional regulator